MNTCGVPLPSLPRTTSIRLAIYNTVRETVEGALLLSVLFRIYNRQTSECFHSFLHLGDYRSMPRVRNELSWRPGYSLTRKPEKKATRRLRQNGTHVNRDGTREFKFIDETITENGPSASLNCGDTPKRGDASLTAKLSPFSSPDQRASAGSPRIAHGRRRSVSHSRANTQLSVVLYNDWLHQYEPILVRCKTQTYRITTRELLT